MLEELKPCPFCGGKARITYVMNEDTWYIECDKCNALMGDRHNTIVASKGRTNFKTKDDCIKAWNGRVA